jgi:hypothetical protein
MKNFTKASLVSIAVAAVVAAPQTAFAHKAKKAHHHYAPAAAPVSSTDARLRQMEAEIQALRSELGRTRTETKSAVAAVSEQTAAHEAAIDAKLVEHDKHEKTHKDLLFFRGGYAAMTHNRGNELLTNNAALNGLGIQNESNNGSGWYIGAGFDHRLTDDMWGLTDIASLDGEVMFEYMNFGTSTNTLVAAASTAVGAAGTLGTIKNQITQFTLTASPKIKFNQMGDFRPWIIPFGLSVNVISPPSSGVTVLNPGLMLGVGGEYRIWESLWAGVDFRYNFTGNDLNYSNVRGLAGAPAVRMRGVSTDGLTAGGYIGFGF